MLVEVATRNHLLKQKGYHPARDLAARLDQRLRGALAESEATEPEGEEDKDRSCRRSS